MNRRLLSSLSVLVSAAASVAVACGGSPRPNVVLVVVDSLRADALGSYGHDPTASPRLDGLATEGLRFERAVATASWNLPSVSSLVTSTPPWVHGQGSPSSGTEEMRTLAEVFSEAGYRTAAFTEVAWPLLQRGFGTFQNTSFKSMYGSPEANSAATTLKAALEWTRNGDDPFFLLVHTYEVHSYFLGKPRHHEHARAAHPDYEGPFRDWAVRDTSRPAGAEVIEALMAAGEEDLAYVRSLYEAAVAEADGEVGRFLEGLGEAGLADGTVVVVTSTNGEGFRPDLKRVHHGGRLHDDLLHVPLIVRWPDHLEPGVEDGVVTTLDVGPTLLALAGVPEEPLFWGRSLIARTGGVLSAVGGPRFHVPRLAEEPVVAQEATFQILPSGAREAATGVQLALYTDGVAFIDTGESAELYDLEADPEQEHDRSGEYADGADRLRRKVRRIAQRGAGEGAGPSAEELEQLRTLGYVQ